METNPMRAPPPSRKGASLKKKYEAIYQYFEQLGPARSLDAVAKAWKGIAGETRIRVMASKLKWWERAAEYDRNQLEKAAATNEKQLDSQYRLLLDGLDSTLEKAFYRDEKGHVISRLELESWDDVSKLVRIRDYLMGNTGRDPKDLGNPVTLSMAVVALMQDFKAEGHDPYTSTAQQARKWIDVNPTTTAA